MMYSYCPHSPTLFVKSSQVKCIINSTELYMITHDYVQSHKRHAFNPFSYYYCTW